MHALRLAESLKTKHTKNYVGTEQLLYSILHTQKCTACQFLNEFGANKNNFMPHYRKTIRVLNVDGYTPNASSALKGANEISNKLKLTYISTEHLLLAILKIEDSKAVSILNALGVDIDGLCARLKTHFYTNKNREQIVVLNNQEPRNLEMQKRLQSQVDSRVGIVDNKGAEIVKNVDKYEHNKTFSNLNIDENHPLYALGYDLTNKARLGQIDAVIGRDSETNRLIQTLSRKTKNNPILVGEAGVGKSAVVEGLALKIVSGEVPEFLKDKIIFCLDLGGIVAGTKYRGEFEKRFKNAIDFAIENGNIIFFIDEIHNIIGAGSTIDGNLDIAELLKPILARGELSVIGATTTSEYVKYVEKDGALERRFQPIKVEEPSIEDAITILKGIKSSYEAHHKIKISDDAIVSAVKLSKRYVVDRFLPDKAIDLIDEASSKKRVELTLSSKNLLNLENEVKSLIASRDYALHYNNLTKAKEIDQKIQNLLFEIKQEKLKSNLNRSNADPVVLEEDIKVLISEWTNIPITSLTTEESDNLLNLENLLESKVIGQKQAIKSVSLAIRRARVNLKDPDRPIGAFIFVGPTGVGKTELAKALAECVFGDKNGVIRLDMSEYSDKSSVNKLIGSSAGYVGYEEEGLLTKKVRQKPYSVILFDEIEKAHNDVFDLLLQILDEGRLTDNKGNFVNFKNTMIILTSNVGFNQNDSQTSFGFGASSQSKREVIESALNLKFKQEFINRLDDVVVFNKLTHDDCRLISKIFLDNLVDRIKENGVLLNVDDSVYDFIVKKGYNEKYGARPIKRAVSKYVEDVLSDAILSRKITRGDKITIYQKDEEIIYEKD